MLYRWILPSLIFVFYNALRFTWRIRIVESAAFSESRREKRRMIYSHWHGSIMGVLFCIKPYNVVTMISGSKDGTLVDTVARWLGGKTARGSSTRGGVGALKGVIRLANAGFNPGIAIDGPKGPRNKVKPGVFEISRVLGAAIHPLTVACDRAWVFEKSWDKSFLPKPFARVVVYWGDPILTVQKSDDPRDPELANRLETAMANAEQHVRNIIAAP